MLFIRRECIQFGEGFAAKLDIHFKGNCICAAPGLNHIVTRRTGEVDLIIKITFLNENLNY